MNLFVTIKYTIGQYAILQKLLFFEGLNKSQEESKRHYVDNKPSLIELCKQRLLLYQSLEASSRTKNAKEQYDSVLLYSRICIQTLRKKLMLKPCNEKQRIFHFIRDICKRTNQIKIVHIIFRVIKLPSAFGVFVVTPLNILTSTRNKVIRRVNRPGITSGGTIKLIQDTATKSPRKKKENCMINLINNRTKNK